MKYLALLFSIYMIILAVLPCRDRDDFADMGKSYTSIQKSHTADEKAGQESCPPFCTCACCSTVRTLTPQLSFITIFVQPVSRTYAQTPVPAIREQSISIWQPPRLA
ncbi:hypothetical protein KHS38_20765 [Mucilaginibacter sp. Bleaf8]|uniref:DUF6660 family protein n=1 Tax=Mucilaginibacter sp. Bleaf8 TaxID=2834430 RepID=UPI001BD1BBED|nr:DUF6660 family protein [Mucilaginibacter sp. Bleaf8]MBS7566850.1 hypothetical protein [Mucilaginibacter sp. Bleaf8]